MTGGGYALRLRFSAEIAGPCMRCLKDASPRSRSRRARSTARAEARSSTARTCTTSARPRRLGARRVRARDAGEGPLPRGLRRAVPGVRGRSQRGRPGHHHERRPIRAGRSCASSSSSDDAARAVDEIAGEGGCYPSRADGRPQEKAVAQPHRQAPRAAQDRHAGAERVPAVPQPAPPAPGLPGVRHLRGPRDRDARGARSRARARPRVAGSDARGLVLQVTVAPRAARAPVVAVDCNGADLGPAEVAAGAALAAARGRARAPVRARRASSASRHPASRSSTRRSRSRRPQDPALAARTTPEASIVQAARAVAAGRAQALVCAGGTGAALAAGTFNIKRARGIYRPALALPLPVPDHPVTLLDVGANAEARREHLVQFAFMGAALARIVLGVRAPRVGLLSNGEEAARGSALVLEAHAELRERARRRPRRVRVRRQRRGRRRRLRARRRDRHRRLHRQHRAEADGGRLADDARRGPRRGDVLDAREGSAACCCAVRCGGFREEIDPEARAAPTCWACAASASCRTGASRARLRPGDPARRARRARGHRRADARRARRGRGAAARARRPRTAASLRRGVPQ